MQRVILVRHGESALNAADKQQKMLCGQFETPLTERGRQQAQDVGEGLARRADLNVTHAVSSSLLRAIETLSELVPRLPAKPDLFPATAALNERSLGVFEGKLEADVFREYPQYRDDPNYRRFREDFVQKAPGGENLTEVTLRAWQALLPIVDQTTGDLLIVSHCNTIRCLIGRALQLTQENTLRLRIRHATPIILQRTTDHRFLIAGELPFK